MNEITLKNFFNYLKNKVVLVIIIIILTLLFSFVYYNYKSTSLYKSSNTILIINDIEIKKPTGKWYVIFLFLAIVLCVILGGNHAIL